MVVHDAVSGLPSFSGADSQAASAPQPPTLDYAAGLERMMGDAAMYLRVLARFRLDYRDNAARLRAALDAGDAALAQRVAHTLKGAAAMIEARGLRQLAADVEQGLRAGHGADADAELLDRLEAELARVMARLDTLLEPSTTSTPGAAAAMAPDEQEVARLCELLDLGDSAAQDLVREQEAGLRTLLGAPRMAQLQAALACFDYEQALRVLRPA
ncbi:MAG: Hpt domain-containing protein [Janthinobacterium lividum]